MYRLLKEDKGVISIMMAILIPVIILGVITVYTILDKQLQENTIHKIIYASSEAYLSHYNAYLFDEMALLANLDKDSLEPLIVHYLQKNMLIESPEAVDILVVYEKMNTPSVFKEAIVDASTILIGNAVVDYGIDLLDQFALFEKIKTLNQSIQNQEKALSKQFDQSGATEFIKTLRQQEVQKGKSQLMAFKNYINAQTEQYHVVLDGLKSELARVKVTMSDPKQAITTFIEAKEAQWHEAELIFANDQLSFLHLIAQMESLYAQIESEALSKLELTAQIDSETQKTPLDKVAVNQLQTRLEGVEAKIATIYAEMDAILSEELDSKVSKAPTLIQTLKEILLDAEYLFSGVEIGSSELKLDVAFKHATNQSEGPSAEGLTLAQKIKLNAYYLSIFSSYDLNCPRVFDPQNRQKSIRLLKGEVEYLISGLTKEKQSISFVRLKIFALRSAANLVTIMCDKEKLTQISTATVALPQPWRTLAYGGAIAAWSGIESYSDINRLMKGEGFYLLKSDAQWALGFNNLLDGTWKNKMTSNANDNKSKQIPPNITDPNLFYLDYLWLLLSLQDEQTTLLRAMELTESELLSLSENKTSLVNFSRGHSIALTWQPMDLFKRVSAENATLHMRNGFE